jgi:hypothetical protein
MVGSWALLATGVLLLLAHDKYGNPNWIAQGHYRSPIDGSHCCGQADCFQLDPDEIRHITGGQEPGYVWRTKVNGGFHQEFIPQKEAQASLDGNYWRCRKPDGSRRCFFSPGQGS